MGEHKTSGRDGSKKSHSEAEYDRLLHRRKGVSGSEFAGLGLQFAITIVLFALAGVWLDKRLDTSPWLLLLLVFGGSGLAFWMMIRRVTGSGSGSSTKSGGSTGSDRQ